MRGALRDADARRTLIAALVAVLAAAGAEGGGDRYYVATSAAACETIDYACPQGWRGFHDAHGCGCERPPPTR